MGNSPWVVVVVRSYRSNQRHLVRMTMSTSTYAPPVVRYERSSQAAGARLARWLEETADGGGVDADPQPTDDIEESG